MNTLFSTRGNLIYQLICGLLALSLSSCQQKNTKLPNILWIMTDDHGYGDIHSHGNTNIDTPVLDRLAEEGARFERFYVSSLCAPTRASLLTGRYRLRTNCRGVVPMYLVSIRNEEVIIAEALKQHGYTTGIFGKWHIGDYYPDHPIAQGFDEFLGFRGGATGVYFNPVLEYCNKTSNPVKKKGYITDILTNQAMQFIEKNAEKPFFCYIPYNAPHNPIQVPDRFFDKYKERGFNDTIAGIYGMIESVDENIGRLLKKLDELKLSENTIVFFLSDNGPDYGMRFNAGMRGTKGGVNEGSQRVPLFVRWPGEIKPGTIVDQLTAHIDIFPTILDLCGIKKPDNVQLDGISLFPLLKDNETNWPDRKLFHIRMREDEDKSLYFLAGSVRTKRWRLTIYPDKSALYDMINDFSQQYDIAQHHPKIVQRLQRAYQQWYKDVVRDGLSRPPIPIGYDYEPEVKLSSRYAYLSGNVTAQGKSARWDRNWIYNWQSTDDYIWWDIDVVKDCRYEISIIYRGTKEDEGAKIQITGNAGKLEAVLHGKPELYPAVKNYNRTKERITEVDTIRTQVLGILTLKKGRNNLYLKALTIPGNEVFRFNQLKMKLID